MSENLVIEELITWERRVIIREHTVTKRELHESEFLRRMNGKIVPPFWAKERLQNEAATLRYIAEHTTIPVPKCQLFVKEGLLHLETERIKDALLLKEIQAHLIPSALKAVEDQIQQMVLPELQKLRRDFIGSVDISLPVFPPQRVYERDRRTWPKIKANTQDFVLCHNDLGPQNIFIHSETFKIVGIIDWEFSGFFPAYFELPLWREFSHEGRNNAYDEACSRELAFFDLRHEDLQDCT